MNIYKRSFLWYGACLSLPGALLRAQTDNRDLPAAGSKLQLDAMPMLNDKQLEPAKLHGQWLVIYHWVSWCPFCAGQTPEMQKLHEQVRNKEMTLLGISIDKQLQNAKTHFLKHAYSFPCAWLNTSLKTSMYNSGTVPATLVYNPQALLVQAGKGKMFAENKKICQNTQVNFYSI